MYKIGVTGGIGSGKSIVCKLFSILGVPVYYADNEAKKLYDSDEDLKIEMIKVFGEKIYPKGKFDKSILREIVFNNSEKLSIVNSLVHPRIKLHADKWMKQQHAPYVVKEAALMIESGSFKELDQLVFVYSPEAIRIQRVMLRDDLPDYEIEKRIQSQLLAEEFRKYANWEINNDDKQLVIPQVLDLHKRFLALSANKK